MMKAINKKGQVSGTIVGIIGLIFTVVIGFVLIKWKVEEIFITIL